MRDTSPAGASTHGDAAETLADRFRAHADDAQHLYGYALRGMADDWEAGGPVRVAAGLNLLLDRYAYRGDSWQFGFADSTVQFIDPMEGLVQPEHFMITDRAGCDLHPR